MTETSIADRVEAMNDLAGKIRELTDVVGHQSLMIENLMASHDELIDAIRKGVEMRAAQAAYFANRKRENLIASKIAESNFDDLTAAILAKIKAARDAMAEAAQAREAAAAATAEAADA